MDEADRLLESSFEEDLETIFNHIPQKRQTLLFSATLTDCLNRLKELSENKLHTWIAPTEELVIVLISAYYYPSVRYI